MQITEKTHPIQPRWITQHALSLGIAAAVVLTVLLFTNEELRALNLSYKWGILILFLPVFSYIGLKLAVVNYQFDFSEKTIVLKQGILSKSERHIPYGRIQQIVISQGLITRLLGLASVTIETASEGGGRNQTDNTASFTPLGYAGNKIGIPGLLYSNAVNLRDSLMALMLANPLDDAHSGL